MVAVAKSNNNNPWALCLFEPLNVSETQFSVFLSRLTQLSQGIPFSFWPCFRVCATLEPSRACSTLELANQSQIIAKVHFLFEFRFMTRICFCRDDLPPNLFVYSNSSRIVIRICWISTKVLFACPNDCQCLQLQTSNTMWRFQMTRGGLKRKNIPYDNPEGQTRKFRSRYNSSIHKGSVAQFFASVIQKGMFMET